MTALRKNVRTIATVLALSHTLGCSPVRKPPTSSPRPLVVKKVEDLGDFTTNAWSYGRDAGNSVRFGSQILWVFGDTFTWTDMHCATAAISHVDTPNKLNEPVDTWFGSLPFYEYSLQEETYNRNRDAPACCRENAGCPSDNPYCRCPDRAKCWTRIALWPGDLIAINDNVAFNLYEKVHVASAPYDFAHLGTGIAVVRRGQTKALRPIGTTNEPLLLFGPDDPNFLKAVLVEDASDVHIYLYASTNRRQCEVDILLARVPLAEALDRSAYRFWDGVDWSAELSAAAPILDSVHAGLGTVVWNDHLQSYLSSFSDICSGGTELVLRTAPQPQGPWSNPTLVDLKPFGATKDAYAGQIHASLSRGRELFFTFYQPEELGIGRIRLGRIILD